jgi:hypothetical protein
MKRYMKSGLTMIAALLLMFQFGGAHAANLKYVRTAKHHNFTRIVFEFQNDAQFIKPVIEGVGKFSVAFPGSTTVLPRRILYKTTQIQPVRSIEFVQEEALLTAGIKLSFPYFKLKAFSLSDPNRVVIDAYLITPPPREVVAEASLHAKPFSDRPLAKESKEAQTKGPKAIPEKSPAEQTGEKYNLQTYMLILLNFLAIVVVLLLSINLLKKKSGINSKHVGKISDSLKTVDEQIAAIDATINREFKKHN